MKRILFIVTTVKTSDLALCLSYSCTLKMEAVLSSETSVNFCPATRHHDSTLQNYFYSWLRWRLIVKLWISVERTKMSVTYLLLPGSVDKLKITKALVSICMTFRETTEDAMDRLRQPAASPRVSCSLQPVSVLPVCSSFFLFLSV
jgi:hypothetical protein